MGKHSAIEWTDHTFNPWWGCEKVSPACTNCYAESTALRYGQHVWGKAAPRRFLTERYWMQPHRWDIEAKAEHVRRRVFCASMADVFEARKDLDIWREKLWDLIDKTRGLDWLLLTKRPENITQMVPYAWFKAPPANVWYGTTVENQEQARKRIPELLKVPARLRFLSCEPLLESVALWEWLDPDCSCLIPALEGAAQHSPTCAVFRAIDWVIVGGESGPKARESRVSRIRMTVEQCGAAGVPVFVKQLGARVIDRNDAGFDGVEPASWPEGTETDDWDEDPSRQYQGADARILLKNQKGADLAEWPQDLRIQQIPKPRTEEIAR